MGKITKEQARRKRHLKIRKKIIGTPQIPRVNIFKSNTNFYAQLIDDSKKTTILSSSSLELSLKNGGNIEASIKVAKNFAKKCKDKKIKSIIFDRSGYIYHGKIKAFADTLRKEGIKF